MADIQRHKYWPADIVTIPVGSATVIEVGDSIAISSGNAIPVSDISDAGSAGANRAAAAAVFLGVAAKASATGDIDDITVVSAGVVEVDQATAATADVGDKYGVFAYATACADQLWVAEATSVCGVVVKDKASTDNTRVMVKLLPTVLSA